MYTGKTEQPCCICDDRDTASRVDLPPRAITHMQNGGPIAWQDIEGEVSIHFCASCWDLVADLVVEKGLDPLGKCNAARASFDLREDFEALLNDVRDEPDQRPLEDRMLEESRDVIEGYDTADHREERDLVEAHLVAWVLAEADPASPTDV